MRPLFLLTALMLLGLQASAQVPSSQRYLVRFTDKDLTCDPTNDFDKKALERRQRHGIAFPAWEDYPVTDCYVAEVEGRVTRLRHALRWWNAVTVEATAAEIQEVARLPFVSAVESMEPLVALAATLEDGDGTDQILSDDSLRNRTLFGHQREMVGMEVAEAEQVSGQGVRIAIFDAGFSGADTHAAFAHLRARNLVRVTRDFVAGDSDVFGHSNHGTAVWSCVAGMYEGKRIGAAVDAEFLLCRTEMSLREVAAEEDHWMAAAEWADQQGADIISSSLGYGRPRHTYADMDGHKTLVTRTAALAVRKGILVVNSAGNEGAGKWHYITAPGDADSVLTVGGCYPMVRIKIPFSSVGPNARGVLKPEIAAPGYVLAANKSGDYKPIGGTSFSCPLMAGLAACLMQRHPDATNMEIRQMVIAAGHFFPYYDYNLGNGTFHLGRAMQVPGPWDSLGTVATAKPYLQVNRRNDTLMVSLNPDVVNRDTLHQNQGKALYYRRVLPDGKLTEFRSVLIRPRVYGFRIFNAQRLQGKLEIWFEGKQFSIED